MIISRYINKEICMTFIGTTFLLLLIFICGQFLSYMKAAALGSLSVHVVLLLLSLQIPVLLTILLPLSLFVGVLLAYGRLYADSEMTVLFASGISIRFLFKIVLIFATLVAFIVAMLSFWIAPKMEKFSATIVAKSQSEALDILVPGKFSSVAHDKWVFYVDTISHEANKKLHWVFAAEKPDIEKTPECLDKNNANALPECQDHQSLGVVFSKGGYQKIDEHGNKFLVLTDGVRYSGLPGTRDYQIINFREHGVRLDMGKRALRFDENMLTTLELWQDRIKPNFCAELHWRIALPLTVLISVLFAVPLSKVNPRYGRYFSLLPAVFCYVMYANLMFLGRVWLVRGTVPLWFGMWWVHIIMLIGAGILIIKTYKTLRIRN